MTETGKPTDPRQRHLTEGGLALTATPGQYRCPGYGHSYYPGKGSHYPAGLIACPSRIEDKHWCRLTDAQQRLTSRLRTCNALQAAWDSGDRPDGMLEALEDLTDDIGELRGIIEAETAKHVALEEQYARERLHATNAANAESKRGPWEFTLTYSPAKHGWSADEAKDAMRTAIERLSRYYREEIEEFHAVGEYTQQGAPHVHAWYKLARGVRITTKSFRRAYPIWNERAKLGRGHEGGHHEPVKRTSDFAGYVEKHLETAWLQIDITNADQEARVSEEANDEEEDGTSVPSAASRSTEPHDG